MKKLHNSVHASSRRDSCHENQEGPDNSKALVCSENPKLFASIQKRSSPEEANAEYPEDASCNQKTRVECITLEVQRHLKVVRKLLIDLRSCASNFSPSLRERLAINVSTNGANVALKVGISVGVLETAVGMA